MADDAPNHPGTGQGAAQEADPLKVLVYSDDRNTRDQVRLALGRRPASDLPPVEIIDVATDWAVLDRLRCQREPSADRLPFARLGRQPHRFVYLEGEPVLRRRPA